MLRVQAVAVIGMALVATGAAAQDAAAGKALYEACSPCHKLAPASSELGPTLIGIVGRRAGTRDDFRYSRALRGAQIVWDETALDAFLADPQAFVAGTRMPFSGIPDRAARANLIAFLKTLR